MPSKGRAEYNKEYYAKNCDDILYRRKCEWKDAPKIRCKCAEFAHYKDTKGDKARHFKTKKHRVWEKKQEIIRLMTENNAVFKRSQQSAEGFIEYQLEKAKARNPQEQLDVLYKLVNKCIDAIDGKPKPKPNPEPLNVIVEEPKEVVEHPVHIPPSAAFDPMSLAIPEEKTPE